MEFPLRNANRLITPAVLESTVGELYIYYPPSGGFFIFHRNKVVCRSKSGRSGHRCSGSFVQTAGELGVSLLPHVVMGHEVKSIVDFIEEREYDILVIGFVGHSALYDRVMGGTCQSLVQLAPCAVLVVK